MGWFSGGRSIRIENLERFVDKLAHRIDSLERQNVISIGEIDYFASMGYRQDDRPKVSLKDAVQMMMDNAGVEFVHTAAKERIELNPRATKAKAK